MVKNGRLRQPCFFRISDPAIYPVIPKDRTGKVTLWPPEQSPQFGILWIRHRQGHVMTSKTVSSVWDPLDPSPASGILWIRHRQGHVMTTKTVASVWDPLDPSRRFRYCKCTHKKVDRNLERKVEEKTKSLIQYRYFLQFISTNNL